MAVPGTAHAAQQPSWATLNPAKWVTTDSRQPHKSITEGDAHVGAWRDDQGKHHIGKSYFTFDITRFKGTQLFTASLRTPEKAANDCTKPRATQLWVVKPQHKITWAQQPWEITKIEPNANQDCTTPYLTWNVADAIKKALEQGKTELTFALRIAEQHQGNPAYGRTYDPAAVLSTTYNTPSGVPTNLAVGAGKCDGTLYFHYDNQPAVGAIVHDADGTYGLEGRFAFWPVDAPEQRVESAPIWAGHGDIHGYFPAGMVKDGGTYAFAARTEDGLSNSAWSAPCQFTADLTPPATAPGISSTVYHENSGAPGDGGEGLPGDFSFDAKGDQDIVAFEWEGIGIGSGEVRADAAGRATISVTPATDGPVSISVTGLDRARHRGPATTYRYWVRTTAPFVQVPLFQLGVPRDFVFTANQDGATQFVYQLDGGAERQLPVGEDNQSRFTVSFNEPGAEWHEIKLWTANGSGGRSGVAARSFVVDQVRPVVDADPWDGVVNETRTITATPRRQGVVSYVYKVGDEPEKQLPAAADGTVTFEYTPTVKGDLTMLVASVNAAGVRSGWGESEMVAEAPAPTVTSAEYPASQQSGRPGQAGTFTFSSPRLPVASYRYRIDNGPEQSTTDPRIQWTPKKPGYVYLLVRGVTGNGIETDEQQYLFQVKAMPPVVTSPQYPDGGPATAKPGEPVEFVVTPALPDSHEVLWYIAFNTPQVVPVGEDGKARFTYTPLGEGVFELAVSSRTPDGAVSGEVRRAYQVPRP